MKSKAPLALMEQLVMVLVFALAAALCVRGFVLSERISRRGEARDMAMIAAQNAAEALKGTGGDFSAASEQYGGSWNGLLWGISYDETWKELQGAEQAAYHLLVMPGDSGEPLLGAAGVTVYTARGDVLVTLPVAWQEVKPHE
ncbi:hypothetical protein [Dysosmobacter sp.]